MNKKLKTKSVNIATNPKAKNITRKEAIKKTGYIAISAATMMILLSSSAKGSTSSPAPEPIW